MMPPRFADCYGWLEGLGDRIAGASLPDAFPFFLRLAEFFKTSI